MPSSVNEDSQSNNHLKKSKEKKSEDEKPKKTYQKKKIDKNNEIKEEITDCKNLKTEFSKFNKKEVKDIFEGVSILNGKSSTILNGKSLSMLNGKSLKSTNQPLKNGSTTKLEKSNSNKKSLETKKFEDLEKSNSKKKSLETKKFEDLEKSNSNKKSLETNFVGKKNTKVNKLPKQSNELTGKIKKNEEVSAGDYEISKKKSSIKKRYFNFEEIKEANLKQKEERKQKKLAEKNADLPNDKPETVSLNNTNYQKITKRLAISNLNFEHLNASQLFTSLSANLSDKSKLASLQIYERKDICKSKFAILNFEDTTSSLEVFNSCTGLSFGNVFEHLDIKVVNEEKVFDNVLVESIEYKNTEFYNEQMNKAIKFKEKHKELKMNRKSGKKEVDD